MTPPQDAVELPPRCDRTYPLAEAQAYPGTPFLDMVLYLPVDKGGAPEKLRLWMLTPAPCPEIEINHARFTPACRSTPGRRWVDFGVVPDLRRISALHNFGVVRFYGVTPAAARSSHFVITSQIGKQLTGEIEDVERELWGITRRDVGRTTMAPSRVCVGEPTSFSLRYETGAQGLPAGALMRLSLPGAFDLPQTDAPGAAGWFEARSEGRRVELLSVGRSVESHEKNDLILFLPDGLPPAGVVEVSYRTEFMYIFNDRWPVMDRRYWYCRMPPLALAVAVDERRVFVPPLDRDGHHIEVEPGPPERLHLILPGRRRQGERLQLAGVVTDQYRNCPPSGPVRVNVALALEGQDCVDLGTPAGRFSARHRFEIDLPVDLEPGVYRARAVDSVSGDTAAVSNPLEIVPADSAAPCIYWGEIHGHCEMSDGGGGFEEMFRHARDDVRLDFAGGADHACYFSDNEWLWMQDVCNAMNRDDEFTALIGYEWAGAQGHRNVYTTGDRLELFRGMYPPTRTLDKVYSHFHGRSDVVAGPHTGHTGDFWAHHDPEVERFLEIYSMWGEFDELANKLLAAGAKLGFTGGGDCHEGRCHWSAECRGGEGKVAHGFAACIFHKCGITAAALPRLTRADLVAALRNRGTYATTGARILVDFSISGLQMGAEGAVDGPAELKAVIHACGALERVDVVRDGAVAHAHELDGLDAELSWTDEGPQPGPHWYYLRVVQRNGEKAWTSPIWVRRPD